MKKIMIICAIIFLTGCSIKYETTIKDYNITEVVSITDPINSNEIQNKVGEYIATTTDANINPYGNQKLDGTTYYENAKIKNGIQYKTNFLFSDYEKSNMIRKCYTLVNLKNQRDIYTFSTSSAVECIYNEPSIKNIKVVYKINYKVLKHNADFKLGNVYTWNINSDNYSDKPIYFQFDISKKRESILDYFYGKFVIIAVVVSIIFFLGIYILIYISKKNKLNNTI